jgi:predicted nucleic acid-binding protein
MVANGPRKRLALDTNLLFHLADRQDFAHAFREAFLEAGYALRFPPTVLAELVAAESEGATRERRLAAAALANVLKWQIHPFDLTSVEQAIADQFARRLLGAGLLPAEEINDALVLAETTVAGIPLLVTSDRHLLEVDDGELARLCQQGDLSLVRVAHPRRLLRAIR